MIDWDKFAERVPAGVQVLGEGGGGILLENRPYKEWEYVESEASEWLRVQLFNDYHGSGMHYCLREVQTLRYLINERWQTFDEIMSQAS